MAKRAMNDQEMRALLEGFERQPAQLTSEEVEIIEQHFRTDALSSVYRRVGLVLLEKTGRELLEMAEGDREHAATLADAVAGIEYAEVTFRTIADNLKTAALRAQLALCAREDSPELLAKARSEYGDEKAQVAAARADDAFQTFMQRAVKRPRPPRGARHD